MAERNSSEKAVEGFVKTEALVLFLAAFAFFLIGAVVRRK